MKTKAIVAMMTLAAALAACLGSGCAMPRQPDVTTHVDQFSGLRTDLLEDNLLDSGEQPRELLWLNASRVFEDGRHYEYYLEVTYMAREEVGLLEIMPGQSLTLKIDGETIPLSGSGSFDMNRKTRRGLVQETALYQVDKLLLQKLAIGRDTHVAVKGKAGLVERRFSQENIDKFQRFVTRYAL